jgi:hypothetical protein
MTNGIGCARFSVRFDQAKSCAMSSGRAAHEVPALAGRWPGLTVEVDGFGVFDHEDGVGRAGGGGCHFDPVPSRFRNPGMSKPSPIS